VLTIDVVDEEMECIYNEKSVGRTPPRSKSVVVGSSEGVETSRGLDRPYGSRLQGPQQGRYEIDPLRLHGGSVFRVPFHVLSQMVRPHEPSLAHTALELLLPRVSPLMARQLVRPRKPPAALLPLALVGLLPGVLPVVRLKMRRLEVILVAPFERALVDPAPGRLRLRRLGQQDQVSGDERRSAVRRDEQGLRLVAQLGGYRGEQDFLLSFRRLFLARVFAVHEHFFLAGAHFELEALQDVHFGDGVQRHRGAGARAVLVGAHYHGESAGLLWGRCIAEEAAGEFGLILAEALLRRVFEIFTLGIRRLRGEQDGRRAFPFQDRPNFLKT
jgi:hypothetical protein